MRGSIYYLTDFAVRWGVRARGTGKKGKKKRNVGGGGKGFEEVQVTHIIWKYTPAVRFM